MFDTKKYWGCATMHLDINTVLIKYIWPVDDGGREHWKGLSFLFKEEIW